MMIVMMMMAVERWMPSSLPFVFAWHRAGGRCNGAAWDVGLAWAIVLVQPPRGIGSAHWGKGIIGEGEVDSFFRCSGCHAQESQLRPTRRSLLAPLDNATTTTRASQRASGSCPANRSCHAVCRPCFWWDHRCHQQTPPHHRISTTRSSSTRYLDLGEGWMRWLLVAAAPGQGRRSCGGVL